MAPGRRDVQMIQVGADMEDVRLLDAYEDNDSGRVLDGLRSIQVRVTGMTCAACSNSVEAALIDVPGVLRASVALLQNRADVVFDPRLLKVTRLFLLHSTKTSLPVSVPCGSAAIV